MGRTKSKWRESYFEAKLPINPPGNVIHFNSPPYSHTTHTPPWAAFHLCNSKSELNVGEQEKEMITLGHSTAPTMYQVFIQESHLAHTFTEDTEAYTSGNGR